MNSIDVLAAVHRGREKEAWRKEILRHFNAGHYRRVLYMMAENSIDQGNVKRMIMEACRIPEPLPGWRDAGREKRGRT
jgi:hypothetical protein